MGHKQGDVDNSEGSSKHPSLDVNYGRLGFVNSDSGTTSRKRTITLDCTIESSVCNSCLATLLQLKMNASVSPDSITRRIIEIYQDPA